MVVERIASLGLMASPVRGSRFLVDAGRCNKSGWDDASIEFRVQLAPNPLLAQKMPFHTITGLWRTHPHRNSPRCLPNVQKCMSVSMPSDGPCQLIEEAARMRQAPTPLENREVCNPRLADHRFQDGSPVESTVRNDLRQGA